MQIENLSLIIPTYKREKQINKILDAINNQITENIKLEIILCDSFSNYNTTNFPILKKNIELIILNNKKNVLSFKRNLGIEKAANHNLILIDDDCIPDNSFINNYLKDFKKIDDKTILSGVVDYPLSYKNTSNYIKFRDSRHFKEVNINKEYSLQPHKVVAMNMGIRKSNELVKIGLFDDRFLGYGFEDYEFAFRYKQNGYKLMQTNAKIIHDEGEPIFKHYLKKHYHLGRDGMKNLLIINNISAKKTIYFKVENNFFVKIILKIPGIRLLFQLIETIIIKFDKLKVFNFSSTYNFARLLSYLKGTIDRSKSNLNSETKNWYE